MSKAFVSIAKQQSESLSISKQQLEQNKLLLDALTRGVGSTRNNFSTQSSNQSSSSMANFRNLAPQGSSRIESNVSSTLFPNRPPDATRFDEPDIVNNDLTNNRDSTDNSSSSYTENSEIIQLIDQASPVVNMTDSKLPNIAFGTFSKKKLTAPIQSNDHLISTTSELSRCNGVFLSESET